MIQLYADGTLIYDSRIRENALIELKATMGLNKGGTATITMPPAHPAYNAFTSYKTVVDIYRDGVRRFRGRALYPSDNFKLMRTITCEGEKCFFRDAVNRPYAYQGTPAVLFAAVVASYNAEVEAFKQFVVGTVTVTDANGGIVLESEEAETFAATIDKLVAKCGGFIVFTDNEEGQRVVNWYASVDYRSQQVIELGSNLMDFSRTTANSDLATCIIPYGAKNEETGKRVTIESVNAGLDFIQDEEAVALRGRICKPVYWDDVKTPEVLMIKAQEYLATSTNLIASLELTAIDLSLLDKNIDSFHIGDNIEVRSKPHGVHNELYQLTEQTMDFLHPQNDRVILGKTVTSLTGADVAGDRKGTSELQRVERIMKSDYNTNTEAIIEETKQALTTLIQQTSESLMLEVSEQYATNGALESAVSTTMTQLSDSFEFLFTELTTKVDANDAEARTQFEEIEKYIRFEDGNIILGERENAITLRIENDRISFLDAGAEVAYFSDKHLTVVDGTFVNSLRIGAFEVLMRGNGNLSLVKVGG